MTLPTRELIATADSTLHLAQKRGRNRFMVEKGASDLARNGTWREAGVEPVSRKTQRI